MTKETSLLCC